MTEISNQDRIGLVIVRKLTSKSQYLAAAAAKSLQSFPTLRDHIDGSPPGSSVPGMLQARILEGFAISFSNACMHAKLLRLYPTLCDPMDSSPPGSSDHRVPQARILQWVAIFQYLRLPRLIIIFCSHKVCWLSKLLFSTILFYGLTIFLALSALQELYINIWFVYCHL